jgi:hypothetical protein
MEQLSGIMLFKACTKICGMANVPLCGIRNASKYVGIEHKFFGF